MNGKIKYAIIGNSTAAVAAAESIRSIDSSGSIAMISDEPYHTYSRPLISYHLSGKVSEEKTRYRSADFYEKNRITPILGRKVTGLDTEGKRIIFEDGGEIHYEKLLISTGSRPLIPPIKGIRRRNVFTFIRFDDIKLIEPYAVKGANAVVIGASFSGLKAVESLVGRGVHVTAVDIADRVMPRMLDDKASKIVESILEKHNVRLLLKTAVKAIDSADGSDDGDAASVVAGTADGRAETIPCDFVIVTAGVSSNMSLVKDTGIRTNRGIIADDHMSTNITDVYTAGDVAEFFDPYSGQSTVVATIKSAFEQGETAGSNMAGAEKKHKASPIINSMPLLGTTVMGAGITEPAPGMEQVVRQKIASGPGKKDSYMKFIIAENRLVGYILVNEANRAGIYTDIIKSRIDITPFKENLGSDEFGFLSMPSAVRQGMLYAGIET